MIATGIKNDHRRCGGFALVAVLIVSMLASMVVVSVLFELRAEYAAAGSGKSNEQAWAAAMSGVHHAVEIALRYSSRPEIWVDNPTLFRDQFVFDDGSDRWYFTVYSAPNGSHAEPRFGLTDEGAKFATQTVAEHVVTRIPGVSTDVAAAILDYLDVDNDPRTQGAEQDTYDSMPIPYGIRNGHMQTIDELLLVRGVDAGVLYGTVGAAGGPPQSGLRHYLTVWSMGLGVDRMLRPQIDLNSDVERFAELDVPDSAIEYVAFARSDGHHFEHPIQLFDARHRFVGGEGQEREIHAEMGAEHLSTLLERTRAHSLPRYHSVQVNVNTASREVLAVVPGMDESLADAIVGARRQIAISRRRTSAWILREGLVDAERFKFLATWLTTRSFQFSFNVVGFGLPSGRYRIVETIVDIGHHRPRIVYMRDRSRLGRP